MRPLKISLAAGLVALLAVVGQQASAGLTRAYTDEVKQVATVSALGITQGDLLSDGIVRLGLQSAQPLRLYATGTDSLLHIGPASVFDGDGAGKVPPPVGGLINAAFADTTIDFQAAASIVAPSGNALTDGGTFTFPSTTIGQFRLMALGYRSDGKVDTHFSPAAASLGALQDPGATLSALVGTEKIGYVVLEATAAQKYKTAGSATSIIQMQVSSSARVVRVIGQSVPTLTDVTGVLPIANGGTALSTAPTNGQLLIGSTGGGNYTLGTITGTTNQVNVANGSGTITLSTPQSIAAASSPTFAGLTVTGLSTAGYVKNSAGGVLSTATQVPLTSDVSGILPTANGGTGQNSTASFPTSGTVDTIAGANTLTNHTISATANTLSNLAAQTDFTGNGSQTDFVLSGALASANLTLVYVDGRLQQLGSASGYTRTNANPGHIIFTSAPDNGSWVAVVVVNQN